VTTTNGAGQGTEIPVADASYFSDGFGVVDGDRIQLEGETARLQIVSIDYGQNLLTVDTDATWSDGQGVGLPYQGPAPDIGAFEYGEEGGGGVGPGGTGGTAGSGGTGGTAAGGSAASGGAAATPDSGDDGGCGCRLSADHRSVGRWVLLTLALGLAWRRRRRVR
jgi:MYXO-CTERM domain-containing protein